MMPALNKVTGLSFVRSKLSPIAEERLDADYQRVTSTVSLANRDTCQTTGQKKTTDRTSRPAGVRRSMGNAAQNTRHRCGNYKARPLALPSAMAVESPNRCADLEGHYGFAFEADKKSFLSKKVKMGLIISTGLSGMSGVLGLLAGTTTRADNLFSAADIIKLTCLCMLGGAALGLCITAYVVSNNFIEHPQETPLRSRRTSRNIVQRRPDHYGRTTAILDWFERQGVTPIQRAGRYQQF